ncbi:MAG: hypothetical protein L3J08_05685 [Flavobacteriaceae bacterium]|nr:hypothetical protein [Flavobacteriaceae bacterium]
MKKIIPISIIMLFSISYYFLSNNFRTYKHLSGIRNNNEIIRVINLLDENFPNYYSLPENEDNLVRIGDPIANHDVNLSEEILTYLNANRNKWQYEYVKNPVLETNQDDYTLFQFKNEESKISIFLDEFNGFYNNWKYYSITKNYNPLIKEYSEELEYTLNDTSQKFWNIGFSTLWNYNTKKDTLNYKAYTAILVYGKPAKYPNENIDKSSSYTITQDILRLGKIHYYQQYISNISRDVVTLQKLWRNNNKFFYTFFSKNRYNNLAKPLVDDLLNTFNVVTQTNAYKQHFKEYNIDDIEFYALPNTLQFKEQNWAYSFWDRRFTEGNMEYVHSILLEIKNHYE